MHPLQEYMYKNNLTISQLSHKLDCGYHYLQKIMKGKNKPGPSLQYRIDLLLSKGRPKKIENTHQAGKEDKVHITPEPAVFSHAID